MSVGPASNRKKEDEDKESVSPPPPDGGWGWMVVYSSFMIHVIADGVTYSFGIFYDEFLYYFKEGEGVTALILSALVGVTLCSGPISSSFVNRWGCRPVTIVGAILAALCMIVSTFAQNVITLVITIGFGTGIGLGLIYLPAIVSVTTYFEKKRSLATGIAVCGSGVGTFIFAPIITLLLESYGWRGSLLIISGLVLNCVIFGAFFRPLEEPEKLAATSEITLKVTEAKCDIHVSDHNLYNNVRMNGNGNQIHRPRSMGHFSVSKPKSKVEENGNIPLNEESDAARLALSQPMLAQHSDNYYNHVRSKQHFGSQSFRKHGPIDRIDVFYQKSLMNIPSYRSRLDLEDEGQFIERRPSTYSYRRRAAAELENDDEPTKICGLVPCSQATKDTLNEMLDFSLFRDGIFILFTTSNFLTSIGFNMPYVYIVSQAQTFGLTKSQGGQLLAIVGGANTIGRIVLGYISDKPWVNRLQIYIWCLTICGVSTALSAFCNSFITLAVYCAVFGFTVGAYVGLTSVILVDLLGLDKLTNAFGLLLLFQGIASFIGPPLGGWISSEKSYAPAFILAGIAIALSGIILFAIPMMQRWRRKQSLRPKLPETI